MTNDTLRRALWATARVACATTLVGCGPKEPPVVTLDTDAADPGEDSPADSAPDTSLDACMDEVKGVFAAEEPSPDEHTEACCQVIAESYDEQSLMGLEDWVERYQCCELLDWNGSLACTPWGPPVPPAMAGAAREQVA